MSKKTKKDQKINQRARNLAITGVSGLILSYILYAVGNVLSDNAEKISRNNIIRGFLSVIGMVLSMFGNLLLPALIVIIVSIILYIKDHLMSREKKQKIWTEQKIIIIILAVIFGGFAVIFLLIAAAYGTTGLMCKITNANCLP